MRNAIFVFCWFQLFGPNAQASKLVKSPEGSCLELEPQKVTRDTLMAGLCCESAVSALKYNTSMGSPTGLLRRAKIVLDHLPKGADDEPKEFCELAKEINGDVVNSEMSYWKMQCERIKSELAAVEAGLLENEALKKVTEAYWGRCKKGGKPSGKR